MLFTLSFHPEVHAPVGERHAKGDAHHHRETLLQRGEGDGDQQSRQQHEITQNSFHAILI